MLNLYQTRKEDCKMLDSKEVSLKKFGRFIRNHREDQGITQETIAEQLGIAQAQYSRIERGLRPVDLHMAMHICNIVKANISEYIDECNT
jgi:transcriptional regulator with XRE-family HTH domain